jgi:TP901 family phage tail tape measure protein
MALNQLGLGLLFTAKDAASGVMKNVRNGFAQTRDEFGKFGSRSKQTFKEFGVGIATMGVGLAGLALLGSTADAAGEFGKAIALVRTEIDEASFSEADMKKITLDLAKQFGRMPTDEAEALYKAVALGANNATKATAIMTTANQLAVAGNSDLKVTMDALGGTLNAYHMDATRASEVSDAMFTAMKGGNTTVGDLAGSIGRVAPQAYEMGIGLDELLGGMAVMTNKGIKASEAVSGLHGALANIVHPSHDAAAEAQRLGIKFNAATVRSMGFQKFLHSIVDNSKFTKDTLGKLFTSVEGSGAMAMLAGDMGNVDAMMDSMRKKSGATAEGFKIMEEKLTGARFDASFKALQIAIGEVVGPLLNKFKRFVTSIMNAFTGLPVPIQRTIVYIALAGSAFVTLVGGVAAAIAAIKILAVGMATFGGGALGTVIAALLPAIALIGLLAGAAYALKYAYDRNLDGIAEKFDAIWDQIKIFGEAVYQLFTQGGFSGRVREAFLEGFETGPLNFAIQVYLLFNRLKNFFVGVWEGFKNTLEASGAFDAIVEAFENIQNAFGLFENDVEASGAAFDAFGRKGFKVGDLIGKVIEVVLFGFSAAMNVVAGFITMWQLISGPVGEVGDALGEVFSILGELISEFTGASSAGLSAGDVFKFIGMALADVLGAAITLVAGLLRGLVGIFRSGAESIGGVVDIIAGIFTGDWARVWNGAKRLVLGIVGGIIESVMFIPNAIATAIDAIGRLAGTDLGLGKKLTAFKDAMKGGLGQAMGVQAGGAFIGSTPGLAIPSAPPVPNNAPSSLNSPALASIGSANMSMDPTLAANAAREAATAAVKNAPPAQVAVVVELDGENLASKITARQNSSQVASYGPMSVNPD